MAGESSKLLAIKGSTRDKKKKMAIFKKDDGREKTVHFGERGADDYTKTRDKDQRDRYRTRHAKEKNQAADTPGALAYHILWGESTSLEANIKSFKSRYRV